MRETGRRPLEGGGEIEDHLAVLPHHNASVGEAAPVEVAVDAEIQRFCLFAAAQEIGMERVNRLAGLDRPRGRDHRLSDHLTAEDALARRGTGPGTVAFVLAAMHQTGFDQPRDIRHALPAPTPPVYTRAYLG